jgi:hypothetical protein
MSVVLAGWFLEGHCRDPLSGMNGVSRRHHQEPALAKGPGGRIPKRAIDALGGGSSNALFQAEVQSFLEFLVAFCVLQLHRGGPDEMAQWPKGNLPPDRIRRGLGCDHPRAVRAGLTDSVPFRFDRFTEKPNPPRGRRFRMDFGKPLARISPS